MDKFIQFFQATIAFIVGILLIGGAPAEVAGFGFLFIGLVRMYDEQLWAWELRYRASQKSQSEEQSD